MPGPKLFAVPAFVLALGAGGPLALAADDHKHDK
jgi:hypothetical protein